MEPASLLLSASVARPDEIRSDGRRTLVRLVILFSIFENSLCFQYLFNCCLTLRPYGAPIHYNHFFYRYFAPTEQRQYLAKSIFVHDSRLTTHDSRLTTHDSRLTTHNS